MGEAKRRGTFEQRLASALERKAKLDALKQPNLVECIKQTHGCNRHIEMALIVALTQPRKLSDIVP